MIYRRTSENDDVSTDMLDTDALLNMLQGDTNDEATPSECKMGHINFSMFKQWFEQAIQDSITTIVKKELKMS